MFSRIIDPYSKKKFNINSNEGKNILYNYLNIILQKGGSANYLEDDFILTKGEGIRWKTGNCLHNLNFYDDTCNIGIPDFKINNFDLLKNNLNPIDNNNNKILTFYLFGRIVKNINSLYLTEKSGGKTEEKTEILGILSKYLKDDIWEIKVPIKEKDKLSYKSEHWKTSDISFTEFSIDDDVQINNQCTNKELVGKESKILELRKATNDYRFQLSIDNKDRLLTKDKLTLIKKNSFLSYARVKYDGLDIYIKDLNMNYKFDDLISVNKLEKYKNETDFYKNYSLITPKSYKYYSRNNIDPTILKYDSRDDIIEFLPYNFYKKIEISENNFYYNIKNNLEDKEYKMYDMNGNILTDTDGNKLKEKLIVYKNFKEYTNYVPDETSKTKKKYFEKPLVHRISKNDILSGVINYFYYTIPCRGDNISLKKILILDDVHTIFYSPPNSLDIRDFIEHYIRKCEYNKSCLDIILEDLYPLYNKKEILETINTSLEGGSMYKYHNDKYMSDDDFNNIISNLKSLLSTYYEMMKKDNLQINPIFDQTPKEYGLKYYETEDELYKNDEKKRIDDYTNSKDFIYQLIPSLYTILVKQAEETYQKVEVREKGTNFFQIFRALMVAEQKKFTIIKYLIKNGEIKDKIIEKLREKSNRNWKNAYGTRIHNFDISQLNFIEISNGTKSDKLNLLLDRIIINKVFDILKQWRKMTGKLAIDDIVSFDELKIKYGNQWNELSTKIINKDPDNLINIYLFLIGEKTDLEKWEKGKTLYSDIREAHLYFLNTNPGLGKMAVKIYESQTLSIAEVEIAGEKNNKQLNNIDNNFFSKDTLLKYMKTYIKDRNVKFTRNFELSLWNLRVVVTETYSIARMFRKFVSKKNKKLEKCDNEDNSMKNIIYFGGKMHGDLVRSFIEDIFKISPLDNSSDEINNIISNIPESEFEDSKYSVKKFLAMGIPHYVNLNKGNYFFKNC